jgi:hypothetical protein
MHMSRPVAARRRASGSWTRPLKLVDGSQGGGAVRWQRRFVFWLIPRLSAELFDGALPGGKPDLALVTRDFHSLERRATSARKTSPSVPSRQQQ